MLIEERGVASTPAASTSHNSDLASGRRGVDFRHRFNFVQKPVIDRCDVIVDVVVNLNKAMTKMNVPPSVMLLALHGSGDDGVDADDGSHDPHVALLEIFRRHAMQGTLIVDHVPDGQSNRKGDQPVELQGDRKSVV